MKLTTEVCTEFVCLSLTAAYTDPLDCLTNFVALMAISELDEIVYISIEKNLLKE